MGVKRHKPEEIVTKLRQVEVLCGQSMARVDAIRHMQITKQTFYRWRKQLQPIAQSSRHQLSGIAQRADRTATKTQWLLVLY